MNARRPSLRLVRRRVAVHGIRRSRPEQRMLVVARESVPRLAVLEDDRELLAAHAAALDACQRLRLLGWQRVAAHRRVQGAPPGVLHRIAARLRRLQRELDAHLEQASAWRPWEPGQRDRPGPYQPTIVCRHGDMSSRALPCNLTVTTDTDEHRTPSWWAKHIPYVAFALEFYPHGYLGKPTKRHRTRHHVLLGRFDLGSVIVDYPLGRPRPTPPAVVVTTPWGSVTAFSSGVEDSKGRPTYSVSQMDWAKLTARRS